MVLFPQKEIALRGLIGFIEESFSFGNFNYRLLRRGIQKKGKKCGNNSLSSYRRPIMVTYCSFFSQAYQPLRPLFFTFFSSRSLPPILRLCGGTKFSFSLHSKVGRSQVSFWVSHPLVTVCTPVSHMLSASYGSLCPERP